MDVPLYKEIGRRLFSFVQENWKFRAEMLVPSVALIV